MAWEWAELTEHGHLIDTDFILFQILPDGTFKLPDNLYLGEAVYSEEEITPSGIIMLEGKKDNLKVKLTHLAQNNTDLKVGDIVLSVDKNNYEFDYWGKKYIKIMSDEIVGVINNENKIYAVGYN
jgi:co-chaperonin GroES (HSP10)